MESFSVSIQVFSSISLSTFYSPICHPSLPLSHIAVPIPLHSKPLYSFGLLLVRFLDLLSGNEALLVWAVTHPIINDFLTVFNIEVERLLLTSSVPN